MATNTQRDEKLKLFALTVPAETTEQRLDRLSRLLTTTYATRYYTQGDGFEAMLQLINNGINVSDIRVKGKGRNWRVVLLPPIPVPSSKEVL